MRTIALLKMRRDETIDADPSSALPESTAMATATKRKRRRPPLPDIVQTIIARLKNGRDIDSEVEKALETLRRKNAAHPQADRKDDRRLKAQAVATVHSKYRKAAWRHAARTGVVPLAECPSFAVPIRNSNTVVQAVSNAEQPHHAEELEGLDPDSGSWGDYPIDDLLIRPQNRTIHDVTRRIDQGSYVMNPDFQRDFIWPEDKQSKLVESVIMRIPLPVFYMAEDHEGRMVVVDGLQRLSTFSRFMRNELRLNLPARAELHRRQFSDLTSKLQNRVEDCNLIFYIIDAKVPGLGHERAPASRYQAESPANAAAGFELGLREPAATFYIIDAKVPERARLDIFERVNSGEPLSRQQMRNSLFMGCGTRFLKTESRTDIFLRATGGSLNSKKMRDREFVNRFCAFQLLDLDEYRGDMDEFLADCLRRMNGMDEAGLSQLSVEFRRSLTNNFMLFDHQAFRKHEPRQERRGVLNASFWDVMSTGLSRPAEDTVKRRSVLLCREIFRLLANEEFNTAITYGPNDARKVRTRFRLAQEVFEEVLGAHAH